MLLSGGIDSATCLCLAKRKGYRVMALTFEYHGIAESELRAARRVARSVGVEEHRLVRLPDIREAGALRASRLRGMPPTYIPLRNSIFYSIAAGVAEEIGASRIIGGHNRDDLNVFRDTGREFFGKLQGALWAASPRLGKDRIRLVRPLQRLSKPEVIRRAAKIRVPLELTWSCHRDGMAHCWRCKGCASRTEAFKRAGVPDPLKRPRIGENS